MTHKSLLPDSTIGTGTLDLAQAAAQSGPVVVQLSGKTGASAGNVRPLLGHHGMRCSMLKQRGLCLVHTGHQCTTYAHNCQCTTRSRSRQIAHFAICRCNSW
jgi:hypothetical protein